jgi:hypothetical protein
MRALLFILTSAILPLTAFAQEGGIGYPTVAAALEALKARSDVSISAQGGWTIVDERSASTLWSFTPPGHPAHPAAVKRTIVSRDDAVAIDMTALCQATKVACDKLMAEFRELNERLSQSIRSETEAQSTPPSAIEVQRLGDDSYRLSLKSYRSRTVEAGQKEVLPKAREICGDKNVGYGKYEFETLEPVSPTATEKRHLILKQEIACGGAAPPAPTVSQVDPQWRPTTAQVELVERQTYAYFAAKDGSKYQEAYAQLSAAQKETTPFERWSSRADDFNSKLGQVRGRSIKKITWYRNPQGAAPGVYAAADFSSQFANSDIHCGYVVWHEQSNGSFLLVREEERFLDKETEQKLKPDELEKVRALFRC